MIYSAMLNVSGLIAHVTQALGGETLYTFCDVISIFLVQNYPPIGTRDPTRITSQLTVQLFFARRARAHIYQTKEHFSLFL